MNKKLILVLAFTLIASTFANFLQQTVITESQARDLATKFRPIFRFSEDEQYWPSSIEDFKIDWTQATGTGNDSFVTYDFKGPAEFNEHAPVYSSVVPNDDGTLRVNYVHLYGYNGCGPVLRARVNTNWGFQLEQDLQVCPMGLHNGDIERVTLTISADLKSVVSLTYAYHDSVKTLTPNDVKFKGKRPVVFIAPGSHASYPNTGDQEYLPAWQYKGQTFETSGVFTETLCRRGPVWSDYKIRLLKLGASPTSDISADERQLAFDYVGRLGAPITSAAFDGFTQEAMAMANILKPISVQAYQMAAGAVIMLGQKVKSAACPTLAGVGRDVWW
jgi:hypothetical protein